MHSFNFKDQEKIRNRRNVDSGGRRSGLKIQTEESNLTVLPTRMSNLADSIFFFGQTISLRGGFLEGEGKERVEW